MPRRIGVHPEVLLVLLVQQPGAEREHRLLGGFEGLPGASGVEVEMELLRVEVGARPLGRDEPRGPLEREPWPVRDLQDDPLVVLAPGVPPSTPA